MAVSLLTFIPPLRGGGQSLPKNPALKNLREKNRSMRAKGKKIEEVLYTL